MPPRPTSVKRPVVDPSLSGRLPPGQYLAKRWPVLHKGEVPEIDLATWRLRVWGLVERPLDLDWAAFGGLPQASVVADFHCVNRWSLLDQRWGGVLASEVSRIAGPLPEARFVILHAEGGYAENLPIEVFAEPDVILATSHDGEMLDAGHGAPVRAVVPSRYAWKSVKWLTGIEFRADDVPGFWEGYGYNSSADPWKDERFDR